MRACNCARASPFQSTHPRGVRPASMCGTRSRSRCFNPRTRVGCDTFMQISLPKGGGFQSTHPRGVRPAVFASAPRGTKVSIHAPAWGATPVQNRVLGMFQGFNPRTRVGCDTLSVMAAAVSTERFNPRTRVGCDCAPAGRASGAVRFQSTHPRGVRRNPAHRRSLPCSGFNPRTRVGCDLLLLLSRATCLLFQSTHPRGVRRGHTKEEGSALPVSIHAPAWGATLILALLLSLRSNVSIHAPAWGAT